MREFFLPILFLTVFFNMLVWIAVIPFNQAPDEFSHFSIPKFIVEKGYYPIFGKDVTIVEEGGKIAVSLSGLPPFAYLVQSGMLLLIKDYFPKENWYLFARLTSAIFILIFIWFSWKTINLLSRDVFFNKSLMIFLSFIPGVSFLGSYVNSDAAMMAASAILIYQTIKVYQTKKVTLWKMFLLGLAAGFLLINRLNGYFVLALPIILLFKKILAEKNRLKLILVNFFGVFLISGWWFIRNIVLCKSIIPFEQFDKAHLLIWPEHGKIIPIFDLIFRTNWVWVSFKSFWGSFDWNFIFLPNWCYIVILFFTFFFFWTLFRKFKKTNKSEKEIIISFSLTFLLIIFSDLWSSSRFSFQPQGRYLYPGLILLLYPLWQRAGSKLRITSLVVALIIFLNIYSLWRVIIPFYYPDFYLFLPQVSFGKPFFFSQIAITFYLFIAGLGMLITFASLLNGLKAKRKMVK